MGRFVCAALSGTLMSENILDYQHIAEWCLGERAPVPTRRADAERWAAALDRDLGILHRSAPGALTTIPGGFHEWFRGSRGVVPTPGSDCNASILIGIWQPKMPPELARVIEGVAVSSMRPDDELLDEWELPDCLSQLALGFWYRWDPAPPKWWLDPRRAWRRWVRDVLDLRLEGFDSEGQVVQFLDAGHELAVQTDAPEFDPEEGRSKLAAWRAVRDQFEPNTVPVWIDDAVLRQAVAKVDRATAPSLVWTRFRAAGFKLAELGVPYYPGGTDPESAKPGTSIALSISAHGAGRNLQAYHRALYLTIPASADAHEQGIGRMHRAGQESDTVYVDYIGSIDYHTSVLAKVLAQARAIAVASGFDQKLTLADWQKEAA